MVRSFSFAKTKSDTAVYGVKENKTWKDMVCRFSYFGVSEFKYESLRYTVYCYACVILSLTNKVFDCVLEQYNYVIRVVIY